MKKISFYPQAAGSSWLFFISPKRWIGNEQLFHGFCPPPPTYPPPPIIMGELNMKICQNFVGTKCFLTFVGGQTYIGGGVIFVTILSLFHLFRNNYHPEKQSVYFMNFLRKNECIRSCYMPTR